MNSDEEVLFFVLLNRAVNVGAVLAETTLPVDVRLIDQLTEEVCDQLTTESLGLF